jgi:hypothetical protein
MSFNNIYPNDIQNVLKKEKLFDLLNEIETSVNKDILKLKTKIIKKIEIIRFLDTYNNTNIPYGKLASSSLIATLTEETRILTSTQILSTLNNKQVTLKNYDTLNKTLGAILHTIYQSSGYNILLANIPLMGTLSCDDKLEYITPEHIYDTFAKFTNLENVESVLRVANDTYLVKIRDGGKANSLCELLNGKMIGSNIIRLGYIESVEDIDIDEQIPATQVKVLTIEHKNIFIKLGCYLYTQITRLFGY